MNVALKLVNSQLHEARQCMKLLLSKGFNRRGAFVSGYRKRINSLRAHKRSLAERAERDSG